MEKPPIQERTYQFALRVVGMCRELRHKPDHAARTLFNQVLRSGTSIGANVEEAQAAQSRKDFISKLAIARKEARETHYWLRLLKDSDVLPAERMGHIMDECDQILRILTSIIMSTEENTS